MQQVGTIEEPRIIPRSGHTISRKHISEHALKVLYRLKKAGYQSYLVGGCVRDLLLGHEPKDFDVATDARPEEVRALFSNCRLIGRRFRLAHVFFGRNIIEVATFRGQSSDGEGERTAADDGRLLRDNVYGTLEEDAWRRDFTVNALYYNIDDFSLVDYTGGLDDLRAGVLRLIGDPDTRYREDPVRMLRAIRFAARLGFRMHPDTEAPIAQLAGLLEGISPSRLFDETLKLFMSGYAVPTWELLRQHGLFGVLYPQTESALAEEEAGFPRVMLARAMENTDLRIEQRKPVTPYFLYAALLWEPVRLRMQALMAADERLGEVMALQIAGGEVLSEQLRRVSIPKRFSLPMREIWTLQPRFAQRRGARPLRLLGHPRFRAAYDFLLLRAESGEADPELAEWWTRFQTLDADEQRALVQPAGKRGRRRRSRKRKAPASGGDGQA